MQSRSPQLASDALAALFACDPAAAAEQVRQLAQAGDVPAQAVYAQLLCEGKGVPRDPELGLHWYSVAATAGHVGAMNMAGRCHERGYGCSADPALAVIWYRRAVEAGLDWAMYNLANLLATGRGVQRDMDQAYALYLRAAQAGHAKSMNLVGRFLEEGLVVPADADAALAWYRRSAQAGDFRGQASLASILVQQGHIGPAVDWLQRAIATGSPSFLQQLATQLGAAGQPALQALLPSIQQRLAGLDPMATG